MKIFMLILVFSYVSLTSQKSFCRYIATCTSGGNHLLQVRSSSSGVPSGLGFTTSIIFGSPTLFKIKDPNVSSNVSIHWAQNESYAIGILGNGSAVLERVDNNLKERNYFLRNFIKSNTGCITFQSSSTVKFLRIEKGTSRLTVGTSSDDKAAHFKYSMSKC